MPKTNAERCLASLMDRDVVQDAFSYLKERQIYDAKEHGSSAVLRSDLARELLRQRGHELNFCARLLATLFTRKGRAPMDFAAIRAAHFIRFSSLRSLLRYIPVGTFPTTDFTATTLPAPKGGHIVMVSMGFMATMTDIAEWCAAALPYWGARQISPKESGEAIEDRLKRRRSDLLRKRSIKIRNLVKDIMLGNLPNSATNFAIAHEYGHILCNCLERDVRIEDAEYSADRIGSHLALEVAMHVLNFEGTLKIGVAGVEIVLQTIRVREALGLCKVDSGHPPASRRLERVHEQLRNLYGQRLINYLKPFQDIFDEATS